MSRNHTATDRKYLDGYSHRGQLPFVAIRRTLSKGRKRRMRMSVRYAQLRRYWCRCKDLTGAALLRDSAFEIRQVECRNKLQLIMTATDHLQLNRRSSGIN